MTQKKGQACRQPSLYRYTISRLEKALSCKFDRVRFDDCATIDTTNKPTVFFSREEAVPSRRRAKGWVDNLSILVKERVIALRLHVTRPTKATRSRTILPRKKRRLLHRLVDRRWRVYFALLYEDTCGNIASGSCCAFNKD